MKAVKHKTTTMATAITMYAGGEGFTATEIRRYLTDHGTPVSLQTVRRWTDPDYAERRRRAQRKSPGSHKPKGRDPLARAMDLRIRHGLSYKALSVILTEYHGHPIGEQDLRYQLRKRGVPICENKSRAQLARYAPTT